MTHSQQQTFIKELDHAALLALPYLFDFWALPHQLPPAGDWRTWVILGGRGAGKTRAGAEWVRSMAEGPSVDVLGAAKHIGLIGESIDEVQEVMVFGESGILAVSPPIWRPKWIAGRKMLIWPNGCSARVMSAHDPDSLRGAQFDAIWADEFAKWRKAEAAWDMIQFGLRLGQQPRACVTTTPRNVPALKALLDRPSTKMTHASTYANRANLAPEFMAEVESRYAGTRIGRQELDGEMLTDTKGALWRYAMLAEIQTTKSPTFDRVVVAVDPPASGKSTSDACGIIVCGVVVDSQSSDRCLYVIEDATVSAASPQVWAQAAIDALERNNGDRMIAEVNQGGDMVEAVVRQLSPLVPFKAVRAVKGKSIRAEPIAALYEQGRVRHLRGLSALEDQMCQMTIAGFEGQGSPDRVDALVWAAHELMIVPAGQANRPKIRTL